MLRHITILWLIALTYGWSEGDMRFVSPVYEGDMVSVELANGWDRCRLDYYSDNSITPRSCRTMVNSRGVRIYCTPSKHLCKTFDEVRRFVLAPQKRMEEENYDACIDRSGGVTSRMRECNHRELTRLDTQLNIAYQNALRSLPQAKRTELRSVQRAWITYRDAKCGFEYGRTGGTIDGLNGDGCRIEMTTQRTKELKSLAQE